MSTQTLDKNSLKTQILRTLQSGRHQHKFNVLGRGSEQGDLERQLGLRFESGQRHLAAAAFRELETQGLIEPTYDDLISPELWVRVTDRGLAALATGVFDSDEGSTTPVKELEQKFRILFSARQAMVDFAAWSDEDATLPIVILFIDIDNFKSINSLLGETVVDEILLPQFQVFLERSCRHRGCAYRQGGEEFVVALPNHTLDEGLRLAERLRAETEAMVFKASSREVRVTISVGVARSPENGSTYATVVRAANLAEHRAKNEGRNRVAVAESPLE